MKIHRDALDDLFSQYIRLRDKVCQRCFNFGNIPQAAHFHGRGSRSVRYDEDNACCLCMGCHSYLDAHPVDKVEFFRQRLGQEKFDQLNGRYRNTWPRPDRKLLTIYFTQKIKELNPSSGDEKG